MLQRQTTATELRSYGVRPQHIQLVLQFGKDRAAVRGRRDADDGGMVWEVLRPLEVLITIIECACEHKS